MGTWPKGTVAALRDGKWELCGRTNLEDDNKDVMEINALTVHNGKFYAGTLPMAGVWRYDGGTKWTLMKRLLGPEAKTGWTRLTSLTVYDGKFFASVGCASSSIWDAPCDVRGKVFCIEVGKCISYDYDLGSGWKHIAAVKEGGRLKLYINGELSERSGEANGGEAPRSGRPFMVKSPPFEPKEYDVSIRVSSVTNFPAKRHRWTFTELASSVRSIAAIHNQFSNAGGDYLQSDRIFVQKGDDYIGVLLARFGIDREIGNHILAVPRNCTLKIAACSMCSINASQLTAFGWFAVITCSLTSGGYSAQSLKYES